MGTSEVTQEVEQDNSPKPCVRVMGLVGCVEGVNESANASEIAKASGVSTKTVREYITQLLGAGVFEAMGALNSLKRRYRINRYESGRN